MKTRMISLTAACLAGTVAAMASVQFLCAVPNAKVRQVSSRTSGLLPEAEDEEIPGLELYAQLLERHGVDLPFPAFENPSPMAEEPHSLADANQPIIARDDLFPDSASRQ